MKQYNKINNLVGWLTFAVAAFTYCMTIEPTASFWDCPEFITTGYKLEVGHPPGAPFFMLTANLFSQFASDATQVAKMVNIMSALMSAACILFLFWSITHLTKKLICPDDKEMTTGKLITIMGAGLVGALAYTWSDTFWFSAVEGEVYAYSSLFTAVVFWLILKWENRANEPHSDRWLILIAYLTGLSIGVHLLNLLCIPAIVLVYYYKKNPNANLKGSLIALAGSMILVAVVLYGIVPGIVKVGGWFELLFVNDFGLPFNTGVIIYMIILAASIIWGVYESYTVKSRKRMNISFLTTVGLLGIPFYGHGWSSVFIGIIVLAILAIYLFANIGEKYRVSARTLNTTLLAMMMIVVGYSSYAVIVIRSSANTPMDQNSPEDIFTLGEYLGRSLQGLGGFLMMRRGLSRHPDRFRELRLKRLSFRLRIAVAEALLSFRAPLIEECQRFVGRRPGLLLVALKLCRLFLRLDSPGRGRCGLNPGALQRPKRCTDSLSAFEERFSVREGIRHPPALRHVDRHARLKRIDPAGDLFFAEMFSSLRGPQPKLSPKASSARVSGRGWPPEPPPLFPFPASGDLLKHPLHGSRLKGKVFDTVRRSQILLKLDAKASRREKLAKTRNPGAEAALQTNTRNP